MGAIGQEFKQACIHHLEEGRQRIRQCLGLLSEAQTWHRPNAHAVSVGNLVLHLCGNVDQWINATLGGDPDHRRRDREFNEKGPIPDRDLLLRLDRVLDRAVQVIAGVSDDQLLAPYRVQAYAPTGIGVLVHVTEHFSYHVGQITLHTKLILDVDTGYYAGVELG